MYRKGSGDVGEGRALPDRSGPHVPECEHRHLLAAEVDALEAKRDVWSAARSIAVLAVATAFVAILSELLVGTVEDASQALGLR